MALHACSQSDDSKWGELCVSEYQDRFAYDATQPEQSCVALINQYRAEMGRPPLSRWTDGEDCARSEAAEDEASGRAHESFGQCSEMAQNSCPVWDSVDSVLGGCLLGMFCEGPSSSGKWDNDHGHHMSMTHDGYTQVACGFHLMSNGKYWVNMNFK
jgi:hypothetical protein